MELLHFYDPDKFAFCILSKMEVETRVETKDFVEQGIVNPPSVKNLEDEKSPDLNP